MFILNKRPIFTNQISKMIVRSDIVNYYEFFYIKKYGNKSYKFSPTTKANESVQKFLEILNNRYNLESVGPKFLSMYYSFHYKRLDGMVIKRFSSKDVSGRFQIYDFIGAKSFNYWLKRDKNFDYLLDQSVPVKQPFQFTGEIKIIKSEEIEKKRFFNSDRGVLNCIEKTTLYNHKSSNCTLCSFKTNCKEILRLNYKKIFKDRGYAAST